MKGAFKQFPTNQQPDDISVDVVDKLSLAVASAFAKYGKLLIPHNYKDRMLQQGKTKTGDLDVLIIPNGPDWKTQITSRSDVVASLSNGPQLMCVIKNLLDDGKQYFVDFLVSNPKTQSSHMFYVEYGTAMPALLGVFSRSLRYKFTQNGLALRVANKNGNYSNCIIATEIDDILKILMLDINKVRANDPSLYSAMGVAQWIGQSPRFDSDKWRKKPSDDDKIVNVNRNAKRAVKSKPEIADAFRYLDSLSKTSAINNDNFDIERKVVGNQIVDAALKTLEEVTKLHVNLLSGNDLREIGFVPGPKMGAALKQINAAFKVDTLTPEQLNSDQLKVDALHYATRLYHTL